MRLAVRLVWILAAGLALISVIFTWQQVRRERRNMQRDVERRAQLLSESLSVRLEPLIERSARPSQFQKVFERYGTSLNLAGLAVYSMEGTLIAESPGTESRIASEPGELIHAIATDKAQSQFIEKNGQSMNMLVVPLRDHETQNKIGGLVILHDTNYIDIRIFRLYREAALRMLLQLIVVAVITIVILRRNLLHPMTHTLQWIRAVRAGRLSPPAVAAAAPADDLLKSFTQEVTTLAQSLSDARASAQQEARLRDSADALWTKERLAVHIRSKLKGSQLVVVSNREPYMHRQHGKDIETIVPASGLVTALEPILNACDGTWVAHGSGEADRKMVDKNDRLRVPPSEPSYTLRRVWLSKQEEEGYYYGFANEGLWPLCHIAHTRPTFRVSDWDQYQSANQKFADAVLEEIDGLVEPMVLVQDYHFALLPRLIKQQRPDARVAIFWHIPWPNPEAFGICPWQTEVLEGLLGADLIGFHIQSHCHNFLETVDRALECRIDWPSSTAMRAGHRTEVKPFPISVEFKAPGPASRSEKNYLVGQPQLLKELGIEAFYLGVGVDRVDYTKGIPERFSGIERFLEKYPSFIGKFTFVQIGAPSRTHIKRYHDLMTEVEAEAERINWKFKSGNWKPIVFLNRHHTHEEIDRFYKLADFCLVTSLHDGMNLVAKEFLASREDEEGMLILSRFTGASNELRDAILINPYDADEMAEAIRMTLDMRSEERRRRMHRMRELVKDQNIYRWAGMLINELSNVQIEVPRISTHVRVKTAAGDAHIA